MVQLRYLILHKELSHSQKQYGNKQISMDVPRIAFANKMDKTGASFMMTYESIVKRLAGNKVIPIQLPIGEEADFSGIINLINMKAYKFEGQMGEKVVELAIPASHKAQADEWHAKLVEKAAEQDDDLMNKFFDAGTLKKLKSSKVSARELSLMLFIHFFVDQHLWIRGYNSFSMLLSIFSHLLLISRVVWLSVLMSMMKQKKYVLKQDPNESLGAIAFKIMTDPFVGRITFVRVYCRNS
jgi:elongation factor G